jgi:HSP20 family protein
MVKNISHDLAPKWKSSEEPRFVISTVYKKWTSRTHIWQPPTDVYETDKAIVVQVEIAGMRDSDITISLEDRTLTISGTRPGPGESGAYHQMEIPSGDFLSVVELPIAVNYDEIEAFYQDGFLRIVLPKALPKRIKTNK